MSQKINTQAKAKRKLLEIKAEKSSQSSNNLKGCADTSQPKRKQQCQILGVDTCTTQMEEKQKVSESVIFFKFQCSHYQQTKQVC